MNTFNLIVAPRRRPVRTRKIVSRTMGDVAHTEMHEMLLMRPAVYGRTL